jgi:hypothetical protein
LGDDCGEGGEKSSVLAKEEDVCFVGTEAHEPVAGPCTADGEAALERGEFVKEMGLCFGKAFGPSDRLGRIIRDERDVVGIPSRGESVGRATLEGEVRNIGKRGEEVVDVDEEEEGTEDRALRGSSSHRMPGAEGAIGADGAEGARGEEGSEEVEGSGVDRESFEGEFIEDRRDVHDVECLLEV